MLTDDQLIRRVLSGESEAFEALMRRYHGLVTSVCRRLMKDEDETLDMIQESFVRAYVNLGQLRDPRRLGEWLRSVASSVCLNRLKKRGLGPASPADLREGLDLADVPDVLPGPDQQAETRELAKAVLSSIARLPASSREPLQMFYLEGASHEHIASRLRLRAGCVRTRLSRARKLLRSELAGHWPLEVMSRTKQLRNWLPIRLCFGEETTMKLQYQETRRRLLRGDEEVTIRPMTREDIPALRGFDRELSGALDEANAQKPPGAVLSAPGGPWSEDQWLLEHFDKYAKRGNITLLAEDHSHRMVGFADLWVADEPPPFGRSLNVECIDYFREHFLMGLETVLLAEAEKVARAAGLPALDIGTNTCSGEYVSLRRFGLKVFYEYDHVLCRCDGVRKARRPCKERVCAGSVNLTGLIRVSHWCPSDFAFRTELGEGTHVVELIWPGMRAILELWRFEAGESGPVPEKPPNKSELFVEPKALTSPAMMGPILLECAAQAGKVGADQIQLPCPSDIKLDGGKIAVVERQFAFAWLRKFLLTK